MKNILNNTLYIKNKHERDNNIEFLEDGHKYIIKTDPDNKYTSVTTWNHEHFPKFNADAIIKNMMGGTNWKVGHKYWGLTPEQIKSQWDANRDNVSSAGTDMHYDIECFINNDTLNDNYTHKELYENYSVNLNLNTSKPLEWQYFINFVNDNQHLKPYRTEWTVYHEDAKIAGSIDMVYENDDGTLSIYDWKRSKNITRVNNFNKYALPLTICHLPDSNFWHYALQLNTYKTILEQKYGKIVRDLYLVRLHPDAEEKNYELIKLPDLSYEINELFKVRIEELNNNNNE